MNLCRLREFMKREELNVVLICSPENIYHFSGFWGKNYIQDRDVFYAFHIVTGKKSALIIPKFEKGMFLLYKPKVDKVLYYGEYPVQDEPKEQVYEDLLSALDSFIHSEGLGEGRIGLDPLMPWPLVEKVKERFKGSSFFNVGCIFRAVRAVKTDEEINRIRKAVEIAESAFRDMLKEVKAGLTELEVASLLAKSVAKTVGADIKFIDLESGERSAFPSEPSINRLKDGDVVRVDFGVEWKHYCCDISRVLVVGEPTKEQIAMHRALDEAGKKVIRNMKPGVKACDLYRLGFNHVKERFPKYRRLLLGHGIGKEIHEVPDLTPWDSTTLQSGMVITSESAWMRYGLGAMNIEDVVVVTEGKPEVLSTLDRGIYVV